jgi:hypothetical protein
MFGHFDEKCVGGKAENQKILNAILPEKKFSKYFFFISKIFS